MQLPFQADGNSLAANDESRVNEIIRTPIYSDQKMIHIMQMINTNVIFK